MHKACRWVPFGQIPCRSESTTNFAIASIQGPSSFTLNMLYNLENSHKGCLPNMSDVFPADGADCDTDQTAAKGRTVPFSEVIDKLRLPKFKHDHPPVKNANEVHDESLSPLDKFAIKITDRVGSVGFFLMIFTWTIIWTGFNILATKVPALHMKPFDPFPAFVAYLLISNVIQILLMPLIMVGQNLQNRHSEIRAELDYQVNKKAELEIKAILHNLEHTTELILQLMKHLECRVSEEEIRAISVEQELAVKLEAMTNVPD
jgi:uncharacterized membrane protein